MGSTRLPGKVLKNIGDKTLLECIIFRLRVLKNKAKVIVATSDLKKDDKLKEFCIKNNALCFRGSEENVLERYYLCAKENNFEHVGLQSLQKDQGHQAEVHFRERTWQRCIRLCSKMQTQGYPKINGDKNH